MGSKRLRLLQVGKPRKGRKMGTLSCAFERCEFKTTQLSSQPNVLKVRQDARKTSSLTLPVISVQAHTPSTNKMSKKLNTKLPPKTRLWYVHASPAFRCATWHTIAHGNTYSRFDANDWYRYQCGR